MRFFKAKHNLLTFFLHTLLIVPPVVAVPPQELYGEPCQAYAIVCFISFFIGTALCALIHKYCTHQSPPPPAQPTMTTEDIEKQLLEKLQAMLNTTHAQQTHVANTVTTKQKKIFSEITTHNNTMKTLLLILITQTSLATKNSNELHKKIDVCTKESCSNTFAPIAYYWMNEYKKQKALVEQYQQKSMLTENRLEPFMPPASHVQLVNQ